MAQATTINLTDALNTEDKTTIEDLAMGVCVASVASIADMLALTAVDGMSVNVEGYYGTGAGGGGIFTYDSALMATNNGGTIILGWVRQCDYGTANVMWFGAKGDGVTDDSAAFQSAFDSIRYLEVVAEGETRAADNSGSTVKFIVPPGAYVIGTSIDMTSMRDTYTAWYIEMKGAVIFGRCVGKSIFDLLNSRRCVWDGGTIIGEESYLCRTGVQIGRDITAGSADGHTFKNLDIGGYFSLACFYNLATEGLMVVDSIFKNYLANQTSYALVQDGESHFGAVSDYVTVLPLDSPQSFHNNTFLRLIARKLNSGSPIWLSNTMRHTFTSLYMVSYDDAGIIFHYGVVDYGNAYLRVDGHIETNEGDTDPLTGVKYLITFTSDTPVASKSVNGLILVDHKPHCGVSVFNVDANISEVVMYDCDVTIGYYGNDSGQTLFSDETIFRYSGSLALGNANWQLDNIKSFAGTLKVISATDYIGIGGDGFKLVDKTNTYWKNEIDIYARPNNTHNIRFKDLTGVNKLNLQYQAAIDKYSTILSSGDSLILEPLKFYPGTAGVALGGALNPWAKAYTTGYYINGNAGVSGTFTTVDSKTITVELGIVTSIA